MLPAIFLLSIIVIILSQLNNCLPKRFLCEKRSRQTPIVRAVVPSSQSGSFSASSTIHAASAGGVPGEPDFVIVKGGMELT